MLHVLQIEHKFVRLYTNVRSVEITGFQNIDDFGGRDCAVDKLLDRKIRIPPTSLPIRIQGQGLLKRLRLD